MPRTKTHILIVDDDANLGLVLRDALVSEETDATLVPTAAQCRKACAEGRYDIVLLDEKLPDADGHSLCGEILAANERARIIFCTGYPSFDHAVAAIRAGAYDYLAKPFELAELRLAVNRAREVLRLEQAAQRESYRSDRERDSLHLVGDSLAIRKVRELIALAANAEAPVLITGETGTGKNLIAQAIHYSGPLAKEPFISINCAALPEHLIEAELFGHEKGAFTGAGTGRRGIFEMAEGGTLLLDEVGEIPLHLQSKLLGVLDDRKIRRLGGEVFREVDVRIIAATSIDLEAAIREKKFRSDLFYRLGVIRIQAPALRERRDDIPAIARHFCNSLAQGRDAQLPDMEEKRLCAYDWPGNVRELRNIVERALLVHKGTDITPSEFLPLQTSERQHAETRQPQAAAAAGSLDDVEKNHIDSVYRSCSGNLAQTSRALGISLNTLKRKLRKYGLA